jgi:hypothetical protein
MDTELPGEASSATTFIPFRAADNDTTCYRPLNPASKEIRIVTLRPSSGEDDDTEIVCSLSYTSLVDEDHCQYEALSYCWGSVSDTLPITLVHPSDDADDEDMSQPYHVTRNLYAALWTFRSTGKTRQFWIDAICINQSDPVERSEQVQFMRHIYSNSERVLAWVGEEDVCSEIALRLIHLANGNTYEARREGKPEQRVDPRVVIVGKDRNEERNSGEEGHYKEREMEHPRNLITLSRIKRFLRNTNDISWDHFMRWMTDALAVGIVHAMASFILRPWFSRAWVLQEVFCAPRYPPQHQHSGDLKVVMAVGKAEVSWGFYLIFHDVFDLFLMKRHQPCSVTDETLVTIFQWTIVSEPWRNLTLLEKPDLLQVLYWSCSFQTSDARDRLFSILGLSPDTLSSTSSLIVPDYTKSLVQTFTDFARWHIENHRSLRILLFATGCPVPDVPSWATYFPHVVNSIGLHVKLAGIKLGNLIMSRRGKTTVRFDTGTSLGIGFHGQVLRAPGIMLSRIQCVNSETIAFYGNDGKVCVKLTHGFSAAERNRQNEDELFMWLLRTYWNPLRERSDTKFLYLCFRMFTYSEYDTKDARSTVFRSYLEYNGISKHLRDKTFLSRLNAGIPISKLVVDRFCTWFSGFSGSLFTTELGDIGCGYEIKEGDWVVVLQSAIALHVLRPCTEDGLGEKFRNFGGCMMYDEQLLDHEKYQPTGARPLRVFEIV